jgi:hypothetical protein
MLQRLINFEVQKALTDQKKVYEVKISSLQEMNDILTFERDRQLTLRKKNVEDMEALAASSAFSIKFSPGSQYILHTDAGNVADEIDRLLNNARVAQAEARELVKESRGALSDKVNQVQQELEELKRFRCEVWEHKAAVADIAAQIQTVSIFKLRKTVADWSQSLGDLIKLSSSDLGEVINQAGV